MIDRKEEKIANAGEKKYGFFTSIALILGIVIGSGIYIKNDSIISGTGNQIDALIAWVLGTVLVLSIILSFIEIMSISSKNNKPGTLLYWASHLIGHNTGRVLGIIGTIIYISINLSAYPMWTADKMLSIGNISENTIGTWNYFGSLIGLAYLIFIFTFALAAFSKSGTKFFASIGLWVKAIPLLVVIITAFIFIPLSLGHPITDAPLVEPPYHGNSALNILSVIPAILFTYNGFLTSAAMMNESKDFKTYKNAFVTAMITAAVIYILYTISLFTLGSNVTNLGDAIVIVAGSEYDWVWPLMQIFVIISVMTSLLGTTTSSFRQFSALSANGLIADTRGKFLRRNNQMVPQYSAWRMFTLGTLWFIGFNAITAIGIHTNNASVLNDVTYTMSSATNFTAILVFFSYIIIIASGVVNRVTKKIETEKNWYFLPAAIISVIMVSTIMAFALYDSIYTILVEKNWIDITLISIVISLIPIVWTWSKWHTSKISKEEEKIKQEKIYEYDQMIIAEEFRNGLRPFLIDPRNAKY